MDHPCSNILLAELSIYENIIISFCFMIWTETYCWPSAVFCSRNHDVNDPTPYPYKLKGFCCSTPCSAVVVFLVLIVAKHDLKTSWLLVRVNFQPHPANPLIYWPFLPGQTIKSNLSCISLHMSMDKKNNGTRLLPLVTIKKKDTSKWALRL
jgi:hypothetical protein